MKTWNSTQVILLVSTYSQTEPFSLGHEVRLRSHRDKVKSMIMIPDPWMTFEEDAVLVAWQLFVKVTSQHHHVTLQVWRPQGDYFEAKAVHQRQNYFSSPSFKRLHRSYALVGQTSFWPQSLRHQRYNLNRNEQFPVKKGDVIGFEFVQHSPLTFDRVVCCCLQRGIMWSRVQRKQQPGDVVAFYSDVINMADGGGQCRHYSLQAILRELIFCCLSCSCCQYPKWLRLIKTEAETKNISSKIILRSKKLKSIFSTKIFINRSTNAAFTKCHFEKELFLDVVWAIMGLKLRRQKLRSLLNKCVLEPQDFKRHCMELDPKKHTMSLKSSTFEFSSFIHQYCYRKFIAEFFGEGNVSQPSLFKLLFSNLKQDQQTSLPSLYKVYPLTTFKNEQIESLSVFWMMKSIWDQEMPQIIPTFPPQNRTSRPWWRNMHVKGA